MPLSDLLAAERIALLANPGNREDVLDAAAGLIAGSGDSQSKNQAQTIADSLRQRERLGSTAIGHGVAIPHGRSAAFDHARAAFVRLDQPVDFGASDGTAVDLIFAMAVPEHFTQQHLQWLAELAERFGDETFRTALRSAPDTEALRALLLGRSAAAA